MAIRVIFSDLHFGDANCSLRREAVSSSVRSFLREIGRVDELILNGDILEANLAPLIKAIEGVKGKGTWPRQIGFRRWLSYIFEGDRFKAGKIIFINADLSPALSEPFLFKQKKRGFFFSGNFLKSAPGLIYGR